MAKKHELRQQLGKAADELELMAGKSEADGFKQEVYDALKEKIFSNSSPAWKRPRRSPPVSRRRFPARIA